MIYRVGPLPFDQGPLGGRLQDCWRRGGTLLGRHCPSRGTRAAGVDLAEALAAKTAVEEAGVQAADAVIRRAGTELKKK